VAGHWWSQRRWSVRTRVSLAATASGAVLMVACLIAFALITRAAETNTLHRHGLTALDRVVDEVKSGELPSPLPVTVPGYYLLQVVDSSGKVLAASIALRGAPSITQGSPISQKNPPLSRPTGSTLNLPGNGGKFYSVKVRMPSKWGQVDVYAVAPLPESDDDTLRNLLIGLIPALVLLLGAIVWWSVGRALRPVALIGDELAAISGQALSRRVTVPQTRDEIYRMAVAVNATLERLEGYFVRQRQFLDDASHEMRSPLAGLLTRLEVAVASPEDEDWPSVAAGALADAERLVRTTGEMLQLARLDAAGGTPPVLEPVELAAVAAEEAARPRRLPVHLDLRPVTVVGDRESLRRLLANLLDNASRHGDSQILLSVAATDGEAIVEVMDDGRGIAAEDRERVFERFVRLPESRARDKGGTGLGLAIAQEIAMAHQGSLKIEDSPQGWGARFVLRLKSTD
jgi:signal transduction histidine kinase